MSTPAGPIPRGKPRVSPARNIASLLLLAALAGVGLMEFSANQGYNSAVTRLDAVLATEDGDLLTQAEVERLIGKTPDGPLEEVGDERRAHYTWRGLVRSYLLTAYYRDQDPPRLIRLGEPESEPETAPAQTK